MTLALPADFATSEWPALWLSSEEVNALDDTAAVLARDLRFEHLDYLDQALKSFVIQAHMIQDDQVPTFIRNNAREIFSTKCFIPVLHLKVSTPVTMQEIRLLPPDNASIPKPTGRFVLSWPVGCVAEVPVCGTSYGKMADRARETLRPMLRRMRIGLRAHNGIHDHQLRFEIGDEYAFDDRLTGWTSPRGTAYDLEFGVDAVNLLRDQPLWDITSPPETDVDKKAELALQWIERARFTDDNLVALLYLFFGLESLLGDKSKGLKANLIATRQMMLSHIIRGGFRHPDITWSLYDGLRSGAVHGKDVGDVDRQTVVRFEWSVRDTLNEYVQLARRQNFKRRGRLLAFIDSHHDRDQLDAWLLINAHSDWAKYLATGGT